MEHRVGSGDQVKVNHIPYKIHRAHEPGTYKTFVPVSCYKLKVD